MLVINPTTSSMPISSKVLLLLLVSFSTLHNKSVALAMATSPARLEGQRVLVTGAGRGIGRSIALICSRHGAKVAIAPRTRSELEETASLASDTAAAEAMEVFVSDVTKEDEVEDMVESIVRKWGGIDILVNNAGGSQAAKGAHETLSSSDLRRLLDLNVVGVHAVSSGVLRHAMLPAGSGRIVNISSRAGKLGLPNYSFYVASKFALEGMTASLAEELKDKGVSVNSISPGMVNTKSFPKPPGRKGVREAESIEAGLFAVLETTATGRYLHVDELDEARAAGLPDSLALKPINEPKFDPTKLK